MFFWNGLWDTQLGIGGIITDEGFNPCFSGMAFGTVLSAFHLSGVSGVSILVFLEWPLGPISLQSPVANDGVSILVFLEWPLGPVSRRKHCAIERKFQSLFFWNGLWDNVVNTDGFAP